ncbi:MAG: chemotaxis protein CheA [Chitinivibrionales bacterium]|nr:chemotaxis protein CheA [Chitinivibrionales bacterium]
MKDTRGSKKYMTQKNDSIEKTLNRVASQLPLLDKSDLTSLTEIMGAMEQLAGTDNLPKAFCSMADRAAKLAENIIMDETAFDTGCSKLGECVDKMSKALFAMDNNGEVKKEGNKTVADPDDNSGEDNSDKGKKKTGKQQKKQDNDAAKKLIDSFDEDVESDRAVSMKSGDGQGGTINFPEDLKELATRFAAQQMPVVEDFEAYILEYEKGAPQAKGAIKRVLHTWKGEFGVLDLRNYSKLIHDVEEAFENGSFTGDNLFKLKDLLASRISDLTSGSVADISEKDTTAVFGNNCGRDNTESVPTDATGDQQATASCEEQPSTTLPSSQSNAQPEQACVAVDPSLIKDFVTESRDHINSGESLLLELENDPANPEHLNSIFRSCHTVKGVAGFLALKEVSELAHSMENVMDMARKGNLILEPVHIDLLLESMDCLKEFIAIVENTLSGEAYSLPESYRSIMERLASPRSLGEKPNIAPASSPDKKVGEILVEKGTISAEEIEGALEAQKKGDGRKIGEILIENKKTSSRQVAGALASQNAARKPVVEETIRVPVDRLDQLVDAIGEAVIAQSMIAADPAVMEARNQKLEKKIAQTSLIMRQVQELSMALRMVSIKSTFQKMARLVRDLSKKSGKEVNFVTDGEETELDKSVVENIGDPLIHMIRNSVDHGIEDSKEGRIAAGKDPVGIVKLSAFHKAGSIYIEISDDGRGLDRDSILKKAVKQGLAREDDKLSDQEIYQFIFAPGFSTAKKITDVSGRGVGMDVVKRNIQSLRGSVEIQSEPGKGTTFSIRLPLTLAIIDGMIVRLKEESYIVPTLSIIESLKPQEKQIESIMGRGEMMKVRGELLNFVRLSGIFGTNGTKTDPREGIAIIVEDMIGKRIALLVDEILGQQQVVIKSLGHGLGDHPGVAGGAIMSDGNVSLILDIGEIVKLAGE